MIYMECPNCGKKIENQLQKYCERCGTQLNSKTSQIKNISAEKSKTSAIKESQPILSSYSRQAGLFDINRNYYILKEKYWDWGSGEILDENNRVIGHMKRVILSIRKRIELQEVDGTISATIHQKLVSARGAQDLKDEQGNLIARIKKKILSLFRPVFFLEDPNGNRWYQAQGEFMGWSYRIKDLSTGEIVAEVEKADKWRDVFLGGLFDFKDTYALRILDNETDRRILLGFVLSIDNVLFDQHHGGFGPIPVRFPRRRAPGRFPHRLPGKRFR